MADGMPRRKGSWKGYPNRQVEVVQRRILFSGWTIGENEMRYIILTVHPGFSLHGYNFQAPNNLTTHPAQRFVPLTAQTFGF